MENIEIQQTQKYVDDLYEQYHKNEKEKRRLLDDPKVKRFQLIDEENKTLMMILQEAKFKLSTLKMEMCDHIFLTIKNKDYSWNICARCGATNKHKIMNEGNMTYKQKEIFNIYKKSANRGIFLECEDNVTDLYLKDVYNDIITKYPDASSNEIAQLFKEYIVVKQKKNPQ